MFRIRLAATIIIAVILSAAPLPAHPGHGPAPGRVGAPSPPAPHAYALPSTGPAAQARGPVAPQRPGTVYRSAHGFRPYGGYPYYGRYSFSSPNGYDASYLPPPLLGAGFDDPFEADGDLPPPVLPTGLGPLPAVTLRGLPATLAIQFPAPADVWVGGRRVEGSAAVAHALSSPALEAGRSHAFDVRAEWSVAGRTFEYARTVEVPAGDRSKVTVLAGTPKGEATAARK